MEILLVEKDPMVRDHVKVGLKQFPELAVTVGEGYQGVGELRTKQFDCVILGVDPQDNESMQVLQHLRSFDQTTELVVIPPSRSLRDFSAEKTKYGIHTFLPSPVELHEFFGFVGRFLERRTDRANGPVRKAPKQPVATGRSG